MRRKVELECRAGIEVETFKDTPERFLAGRHSKTVIADRAGKDEHKTGGAVIEFAQRDFVAQRRIGMFDPRQHLPRRGARPRRDRPRIGAALCQRRDRQAVVSRAGQALKRRALEHRIDEFPPLFTRGRREIGRKQQSLRIGHGGKMPCRASKANRVKKRGGLTAAAAFRYRLRPRV